jgi:hypothetical protein
MAARATKRTSKISQRLLGSAFKLAAPGIPQPLRGRGYLEPNHPPGKDETWSRISPA